jgi:hypothetical protein
MNVIFYCFEVSESDASLLLLPKSISPFLSFYYLKNGQNLNSQEHKPKLIK